MQWLGDGPSGDIDWRDIDRREIAGTVACHPTSSKTARRHERRQRLVRSSSKGSRFWLRHVSSGFNGGDEAKGKLVDLLAPRHDAVVRYQGGANAGHTVVCGDQVYKLHHVPSGILHPGVMNFITPGVVIEPTTLLGELEGLEQRGINPRRNLLISERAHLVMPWHLLEDQAMNQLLVQGENIGTTLRGIGPCYRDKVGRTFAVRASDLLQPDLPERLTWIADTKRRLLAGLEHGGELAQRLDTVEVIAMAQRWAEQLGPLIGDTTHRLHDALEAGQQLLMEGAQGSLLDIDHGTYPFVTSSNSSGVGICSGSGVPPRWIAKVIGVAKAYSTRVGGGPFPTELHDETGEKIRQLGNEFGTTTGRPRRCGWFDAVAVRYTARLGGIDCLALMMMDVLAHFDELKVCVAYEVDGQRIDRFPCDAETLRRAQPVYETIQGWKKDVTGARSMEDLPEGAHRYLNRISELIGVPVAVVSVGPDREQTIFVDQQQQSVMAACGAPS
ncbi:MAG: adenylosuccinate synthetase [Pirellulaceae bacterium]|nr:MAG: adenylosuccinate synthetase [Pirellulaceae bacterium]